MTTKLCWDSQSHNPARVYVSVKIKTEVFAQSQYRMLSLWEACVRGDITSIRLAVQGGADVNERDGVTMTPLMWAAHRGKAEISELLLQQPGIDIDCMDWTWRLEMRIPEGEWSLRHFRIHDALLFLGIQKYRLLYLKQGRSSRRRRYKEG